MPRWLTRIRTPATLTMALSLILTSFAGVPGWVRSAVVIVFLAGLVSLYLPAARPGTAGRTPTEAWPPASRCQPFTVPAVHGAGRLPGTVT